MKKKNEGPWFVRSGTDGFFATEGWGRAVNCESEGEAQYVCDELNKFGDLYADSRSDYDEWEALVDKAIKDYNKKPKAKKKKLKNSGKKLDPSDIM